MKTNAGNRASPDWRALCEGAILELDPAKVPQRINEAQHAIMDRMEDLNRSEVSSESEALMNAVNAVLDIRRMAQERKPEI